MLVQGYVFLSWLIRLTSIIRPKNRGPDADISELQAYVRLPEIGGTESPDQ